MTSPESIGHSEPTELTSRKSVISQSDDEATDSVSSGATAVRHGTAAGRREKRPWLTALLVVVPFFLLGLAWAGSNPPGAAPDEGDHLVKAIGMGHFDIGEQYQGPPLGPGPTGVRNASIARVVDIPTYLRPSAPCWAFASNVTPACIPGPPSASSEVVSMVTPIGAYPPFMYVPVGAVAQFMDSPGQAFFAGRVVVLIICALLVWLACTHLVKWLGRSALLGVVVAISPMVIFTASSISTSGFEIAAALVVAAVVVVAGRIPHSLQATSTHFTLAAGAVVLVLSRQLGVIALAIFMLALIAYVGWRPIVRLFVRPKWSVIVTVGLIIASIVSLGIWELKYDNPELTGPILNPDAIEPFMNGWMNFIRSGIGTFGWLDSPLPEWAYGGWMMIIGLIVGAAFMIGRRTDRQLIPATLLVIVLGAFATYASLFYPVGAATQGRHFLAIFMIVPLIAGVAVAERLQRTRYEWIGRRLYTTVGLAVAVIQLVAIYFNARRYAIGVDGPLWFLGAEQWAPRFGWTPWLLLAFIGSVALAFATIRLAPTQVRPRRDQLVLTPENRRERSHVGR